MRTAAGMLLANAGAALVRVGRWAEADRLLQMAGDIVSSDTLGGTYRLLQRYCGCGRATSATPAPT
jgi:hypothetical protein